MFPTLPIFGILVDGDPTAISSRRALAAEKHRVPKLLCGGVELLGDVSPFGRTTAYAGRTGPYHIQC